MTMTFRGEGRARVCLIGFEQVRAVVRVNDRACIIYQSEKRLRMKSVEIDDEQLLAMLKERTDLQVMEQ